MSFYSKSCLQKLFWEIKTRFFYVLLSFFLSFAVAYLSSTSLLYLFTLSYTTKSKLFFSSYLFSKLNSVIAPFSDKNTFFVDFSEFSLNYVKKGFSEKETAKQTFFEALAFKNQKSDLVRPLASFEKEERLSLQEDLSKVIEDHPFFLSATQSQNGDNFLSFFNNAFLCTLSEQSLLTFSKDVASINLNSIHFIFTDVEEAFSSQLLICFIFCSIMSFPVVMYALLSFLLPSLHFHESKKWISHFFLVISIWYCFTIIVQNKIIPNLVEFLLRFQITSETFNVRAETKIYSYCTWATTIFIATNLFLFFLYFLFSLMANQRIEITRFTQHRNWCRIALLLISACLAPPDLAIQLALTFFFFLCFEVFALFFFIYRHIFFFRR